MNTALVWSVAAGTIAGIIFRPKNWPEAIWACLGALTLVIAGLVSLPDAGRAVAKGTDVYLFLAGMMVLAELAHREGVFDWLATHAVGAARGSRGRLFDLIYAVGILVTVFLSNDATAVVLTPAVYAAVRKSSAEPLPYLLICAFVANAASFVLPVSNPANLIVYGKTLPPLAAWLRIFLLPSACAIVATWLALRWLVRSHLQGAAADAKPFELPPEGRRAAWGIAATGAVLIASALGLDLGLPTSIAAIAALLAATRLNARSVRQIAAGVPWSVLPLVAGLFVLVEALDRAGALRDVGHLLEICAGMPRLAGPLAASFGVSALSNAMNNLPSGLLMGAALKTVPVPASIRDAVLIGVDLGPNLSITGSLATVLWLVALRREGEHISGSKSSNTERW